MKINDLPSSSKPRERFLKYGKEGYHKMVKKVERMLYTVKENN